MDRMSDQGELLATLHQQGKEEICGLRPGGREPSEIGGMDRGVPVVWTADAVTRQLAWGMAP
jgi:hypothetical protein